MLAKKGRERRVRRHSRASEMRVPVTLDEDGDLLLARADETGMYLEVADACAAMLADAAPGTKIRICEGED